MSIRQRKNNLPACPTNPFANKSINLPSNLLSHQRKSKQQSSLSPPSLLMNIQTPFLKNQKPPGFIEQKLASKKKKEVLYKRLTNIRHDNEELGGMSFSKLLSRMVVMDDDKQQHYSPENVIDFHRKKKINYVTCLKQKQYNLNYNPEQQTIKKINKSIDLHQSAPSKKLFKKYYMPNSQVQNPKFFQTMQPGDKYVYNSSVKKMQCKRIHNFYTSHMFKRGVDKFFRRTIDGFDV